MGCLKFSTGLLLLAMLFITSNASTTDQDKAHCPDESEYDSNDHKSLFPLNAFDICGSLAMIVVSAFANAGGAGGGGIYVPLLIITMQFSPHEGIPLSHAMILGGALTFVALTIRRKDPMPNMPAIDYDIALLFEPMILCGVTVGVILNRIVPAWILLVLLELLLAITLYRTGLKGYNLYKKETSEQAPIPSLHIKNSSCPSDAGAMLAAPSKPADPIAAVLSATSSSNNSGDATAEQATTADIESPAVKKLKDGHVEMLPSSGRVAEVLVVLAPASAVVELPLAQRSGPGTDAGATAAPAAQPAVHATPVATATPAASLAECSGGAPLAYGSPHIRSPSTSPAFLKMLVLGFIWALVVLLTFLRGGEGASSWIGISTCSAAYWLLTFAHVPVCLAVSAMVGWRLRANGNAAGDGKSAGTKAAGGSHCERWTVEWTPRKCILYPLCCFATGLAAGLLGIGGGLLLGPLLLEMGIIPQVAAATSSLMVLFTASSSVVQFAIMGQLQLDYALWLGCFTAFGAVAAVHAVRYAVERFGRPSYIVLSLGAVIGVSAVLIASSAVPDLVADITDGENMFAFHSFCDCA